jgi:soluble lytic murein transglycosylase
MRFQYKRRRLVLLWVAAMALAVLAGCADPPPTPAPVAARASATITPVAVAQVTTAVAAPTPTPTQTSSPTPTATATPTRTPTPTPTLEPNEWLDTARQQQEYGQYDQAIASYLALLDDAPNPAQARQARYGLAETYLCKQDYAAAAGAWQQFLADYPDDGRRPQVELMAGQAYQAGNDCEAAIPYYRSYLEARTILADLVYEWLGDCYAELSVGGTDGQEALEQAIAAYRQALALTQDGSAKVGLLEKIAGIHLARQAYGEAVAQYDAILDVARIESYRARIEYLAGQALAAAGDVSGAQARYRRAVDRYPRAEYAYLALVELVEADVPVDEFQRGLVDYYAGDNYPDAYGAAIRAFDRYLAAGETATRADEALYYKALAQRGLDQPQAALETLEALIVGYPESEWLPKAWLEQATTLAGMEEKDKAVKRYRDTAAFFPDQEVAPQALWQAARLLEGEGDFAGAAALYEEMQSVFPGAEDAEEALWRAGLQRYRTGDLEGAATSWQTLLEYPQSSYRKKALYWLGKLEPELQLEEGGDFWAELVESNPRDYYALRVEQVRSGEMLTATRLISAPVAPLAWDPVRYEAEVLDWLQSWTEVPTGTQRLALPPALSGQLDLQRGEELQAVGLRRQALDAFGAVRVAAWDDPLALAGLVVYFQERGFYGMAARCAVRLGTLWPDGNIFEAPVELQRVAYPLPYAELLTAAAQKYVLDPLLLAALIRQESLFEKEAESYAGARGLGQVMPATGQGIAQTLDMEDFVLDDLYRPVVSIEFGAFYLSVQMGRFDDRILVALAAYNGGPGNTLRWLELGGEELDFFVEMITASQSRIYLQRVYEQYMTYERLYRPDMDQNP